MAQTVGPFPDRISLNPELHHYTTFAGLEGIVKSNSLWATHYSSLNDSSEILFVKSFLAEELKKHIADSRLAEPIVGRKLSRSSTREFKSLLVGEYADRTINTFFDFLFGAPNNIVRG